MTNGIVIDKDVLAVAEFMQKQIAANRLVSVADGVAAIAPLLWARHGTDNVETLRLDVGAIASAERTPAASSE